jgi:hypothetical protein
MANNLAGIIEEKVQGQYLDEAWEKWYNNTDCRK